MQSSSFLRIDLDAIRMNYRLLCEKMPKGRVMPIIKAQAYGTNAVIVAKCLEECGATIFGVSHVSEAIALRKGGIQTSIFVLNAPYYELEETVHFALEPAISNFKEAIELNRIAEEQEKVIRVHLHMNTGMQRLGMRKDEIVTLAEHLPQLKALQFEGIFSHFVSAESCQHDNFSFSQMEAFKNTLNALPFKPRTIHMASSSGYLRFSLPFCNMARLGLLLYGIPPFEMQTNPLKPALSLHSCICGINSCAQGETVGYKRTFVIEKATRIGVIPLGYHDGIRQFFSQGGYVLIHNKQAPIVGRICMDFFMVDLGHIPEANIGDPVLIFGKGLPPGQVASWGELNVRELLTGLGPRIQRQFDNHSTEVGQEGERETRKAILTV